MEETIALIDKIIKEHSVIGREMKSLEQATNDAEGIMKLEKAKDEFVPGRFEQKQGLKELQASLERVIEGLEAHFSREETALLAAFEEHGNRELATGLRSLLLEHEDLRNRFAHSREHVAELIGGGLSHHLWEASANDMRAHLSHTRKLLEAHAEIEQEILKKLRSELKGTKKG